MNTEATERPATPAPEREGLLPVAEVERLKRIILDEGSFNISGVANAKSIVAENLARAILAASPTPGLEKAVDIDLALDALDIWAFSKFSDDGKTLSISQAIVAAREALRSLKEAQP